MSHKMAFVFPVLGKLIVCFALSLVCCKAANAQMREIYSNPLAIVGTVQKLDFYSPVEGYVAFENAIGFTTDSGDNFVRFIYITSANVDFGSFWVDPLSKFTIRGVKAYDRNNILVYGGYPLAPAILQSSDGGNSFRIVLATRDDDVLSYKGDVADMLVLRERNITLAVDPEHIYRSANKGLTWDTIQFLPNAYLTNLDGYYNSHVYAWSTTHPQNYIYRSGTDGGAFSPVNIPGGGLKAVSFINADEGYINVNGPTGGEIYYTPDAGSNWYPKSNAGSPPLLMNQLKFINAGTGYALVNRNDTYRTRDSAQTWEKIPRQNFIFSPQDLKLNTLHTFNGNQLWTGGESSLIELNTNLNGPVIPELAGVAVVYSVSPASGFAGTPVTIKGIHFSGSVSVSIGSVNVPDFTVISDSVITAVIVKDNNGSVKVTNTSGASIDGPSFYYPPLPVIDSFSTLSLPKISSFSPQSGVQGTIVDIYGENFNAAATANFVRFGAVYGKIINATPTHLQVEAPAGASSSLLEVTVNGFTCSAHNFFTLHTTVQRAITDTTFKFKLQLMKSNGAIGSKTESADLDGDGKTDLIFYDNNELYKIARNTSTGDNISFVEAATIAGISSLRSVLFADIDGDGKLDLIGSSTHIIKIFRNSSTPGNIRFDDPVERVGGTYSYFRVIDINSDGKPEIAGMDDGGDIYLFTNTSSGSTISFGSFVRFNNNGNTRQFELCDLDGDDKPELIVPVSTITYPERSMLIFQNTSTTGAISYGPSMPFNGGGAPVRFLPADLNSDAKTDLLIQYYDGMLYAENTSSNGIIAFAPVKDIFTNNRSNFADISDLNGDGLPDIVVEKDSDSTIYIYENTTTNNLVSFTEVAKYATGSSIRDIIIRDLNNSGSPEIIIKSDDSYLKVYSADYFPLSPDTCKLTVNIVQGRDSLCSGNQVVFSAVPDKDYNNTTFQWLINNKTTNITGAVFRSPLFKTGDKISVIMSGATDCGQKADTSNVIIINSVNYVQNSIVIVPGIIDLCNTSTRTFRAGAITGPGSGSGQSGGNNPSAGIYHWKLNGQPVGNNNENLSLTDLKVGDIVWLTYLFNTPCKRDTVLSNKVVIAISNRIKPTAIITGIVQVVRSGETVIKAEVIPRGISERYQWQDSTSAHSWNPIANTSSQFIHYRPGETGDKLRSLIITEDACGFNDTLTTSSAIFTIADEAAPMANFPVRAYPNPVGNTLTLDNINPFDNWQSFELLGPDGHQHVVLKDIRNRTSLTVNLANLPRGLYIVQFKRATGEKAFRKIMKL